MPNRCDHIITNVNVATMSASNAPYGAIENAVIAIKDNRIVYLGSPLNCPYACDTPFDAKGQWAMPGFIDCHTHLVFAGSRATEFELRQQGVSYEQIAQHGGGIKSTVAATRSATEAELLESALKRASRLVEEGVTCIEVKSGYGLDTVNETKMLRVAKQLEDFLPVHVVTTFLGAHALPAEYTNDADAYIDKVCNEMIPYVATHKLASAVDVFCESIGFTPAQCERVFKAAIDNGLAIKAHVEQLSDLKGALLAGKYHALSVDHLEYLQEQDVEQLAKSSTVAVMLPGAYYYLRETQLPPIDALRKYKVPMAVATDLNPGTSPIASLLTSINMACILFRLTPEEALLGVTRNAARALDLSHKGQIAVGFDADICLWDIQHPAELAHSINTFRPTHKWVAGNYV